MAQPRQNQLRKKRPPRKKPKELGIGIKFENTPSRQGVFLFLWENQGGKQHLPMKLRP